MSKIDTKLERFTNDIMSDVGDERRIMLEAVDKELREEYEKEETAYLSKAYDLIQDALIKIDQEKNEMLSRIMMDNKTRQLQKRNELIEAMFDEAKNKLKAFAKSDAYMDHMMELIENAKSMLGSDDVIIFINDSDKEIVEKLANRTGLSVRLESKKVDFIGGCKILCQANNMIVDYTFLRKLDDQREDFIFNCHLDVE